MTKVFKVIMSVILIILIAALVAMFVPPLLGVTTTVAEPNKATNMQVGSVAYGTRESISDLSVGDSIIYNTDSETYIYDVKSIDNNTGEITVTDNGSSNERTLELRRTASKKLLVIPLMGYISIALQSTLGSIILILVAVLIVVLFIAAEVMCRKNSGSKRKQKVKDSSDDDDDSEDDNSDSSDNYFAELEESKNKPNRLDALQTQDESISATKAILDGDATIPTQPITDDFSFPEEDTDTFEAISNTTVRPVVEREPAPDTDFEYVFEIPETDESSANGSGLDPAQAQLDEVDESEFLDAPSITTAENANANADNASSKVSQYTDSIPDMRAALEAALNSAQVNRSSNISPVNPVMNDELEIEMPDEIELAIPVRTLESLLSDAYTKGEDPSVIKDDASGVTFVDFSNYLN